MLIVMQSALLNSESWTPGLPMRSVARCGVSFGDRGWRYFLFGSTKYARKGLRQFAGSGVHS